MKAVFILNFFIYIIYRKNDFFPKIFIFQGLHNSAGAVPVLILWI